MGIQYKQSTKLDFDLVTSFRLGYRNREDITNLPIGVLTIGSQNVVTNTSGRISIVKGYTLDGQSSITIAGILSAYDFETSINAVRHLRAYTDPTSNLGVLQVRVVNGSSISWINVKEDLTKGLLRFCSFWDTTELESLMLFVDGSSNIREWNGAMTTFASATANTITKEGVSTWAESGFYTTRDKKIVINGIEYTYTGGETTTTLTGVTPDPTSVSISVGDNIFQQIVTTANSAMTGLPAAFINDYISILNRQIYLGSNTSRYIYVSKVDDYKNFNFSTNRLVGEGEKFTIDANCRGFISQEGDMYITTTQDYWYQTNFQLSSDNAKESLTIIKLKTARDQGAKSQELITKDKNNVVFVSNEPVLTKLGRVENIYQTPQMTDISFPIVNDFNSYDFTDGTSFYHKNFLYVAIPKEGVIRIYNQTDANNHYWEAPVTYPISCFSEIDGNLYGHSYNTPETYKLFTGYNFNGFPIPALAAFSYQNFGTRARSKGFSQFYSEGYIGANGVLNIGVKRDYGGCAIESVYTFDGDQQPPIVCTGGSSAPLGKESIGYNPIGGELPGLFDLPPKFRIIKTMPLDYGYEFQFSFFSTTIDFHWEIVSFGTAIVAASDLNSSIKD